jgi:hypothetical protein
LVDGINIINEITTWLRENHNAVKNANSLFYKVRAGGE